MTGSKRLEAYKRKCEEIPKTSLLKVDCGRVASPDRLFAFKKKIAESLGTGCMLNCVHGIGNRRPENVGFSWFAGVVSDMNLRPDVSSMGMLESNNSVPFRLTPNMSHLLGSIGVGGPFTASLSVSMDALESNPELVSVYMKSIISNVLGALMVQRSVKDVPSFAEPLVSADDSTMEYTLRLEGIVEGALKRLKNVSKYAASSTNVGGHKLTRAVDSLVQRSMQVENLADMDPSWQAWF